MNFPFGLYKGKDINIVIRDLQYSKWLLKQSFFKEKYPNLYQIIYSAINNQEQFDEKLPIKQEIGETFEIPEYLLSNLLPYQKDSVFLGAKFKRFINASHVGIGKSLSSLALVESLELFPCLIICPASLKINWSREIAKWLNNRTFCILDSKTEIEKADFIIINYDILTKRLDELKNIHFNSLISDEFHACKGKSARSAAVEAIAEGIEYRIGLSATPMLNNPQELIQQLKILDRLDDFGGWMGFTGDFCGRFKQSFRGKSFWNISGATRLKELNQKLLETCMIRYRKEDVLEQIPEKRYNEVYFDIDNRKEYEEARDSFLNWISEEKKKKEEFQAYLQSLPESQREHAVLIFEAEIEKKYGYIQHLAQIEPLKQLAAKGKLEQVKEWIENFLESGEKLVLFADHKEIQKELKKAFPKSSAIFGDMTTKVRQENIDNFENGKTQLMIASLKAGGVGLNLPSAHTVALLELPWVPGMVDQATGRCVVEGQHILTSSGVKKIEDAVIGDCVLTHKGNWKKILGIKSKEDREGIVSLVQKRYSEKLKFTKDHKILVLLRNKTNPQWVEAQDVRVGDFLCSPRIQKNIDIGFLKIEDSVRRIPLSQVELLKTIKCSEKHCNKKPFSRGLCGGCRSKYLRKKINLPRTQLNCLPKNYTVLPEKVELSDDLLFIFGYYLADGFIQFEKDIPSKLGFAGNQGDKLQVLQFVRERIESIFKVNTSLYFRTKGSSAELKCFSRDLACWVYKLFNSGSHEKKIPDFILNLPKNRLETFIDGYLAGDGYKRTKNKNGTSSNISFNTVNDHLAYQLYFIIIKLGYHCSLKKVLGSHYSKGYIWVGSFTKDGNQSSKNLNKQNDEFVYNQITEIKLENYNPRIYDLEVEDDSSFVVGISAVHNCERLDQKSKHIDIYFFLAQNTIDEGIYALLKSKEDVIDIAVDGKQQKKNIKKIIEFL